LQTCWSWVFFCAGPLLAFLGNIFGLVQFLFPASCCNWAASLFLCSLSVSGVLSCCCCYFGFRAAVLFWWISCRSLASNLLCVVLSIYACSLSVVVVAGFLFSFCQCLLLAFWAPFQYQVLLDAVAGFLVSACYCWFASGWSMFADMFLGGLLCWCYSQSLCWCLASYLHFGFFSSSYVILVAGCFWFYPLWRFLPAR